MFSVQSRCILLNYEKIKRLKFHLKFKSFLLYSYISKYLTLQTIDGIIVNVRYGLELKGRCFMKSYNGTSDVGNIFVISGNSHPACLVQADIETRIKDNTKIFVITNEGENEYTKHCEVLQGKQVSISEFDGASLENRYNIFEITDSDRLQADFTDKLRNTLTCILENIQSANGKKAIYLNNIYPFLDSGKTGKCIKLLAELFKNANRYDCSVIVFNWKPDDFTKRYRDDDTDYTTSILSNVKMYIVTSIQDSKDMKIVSDVFHLTENEENTLKALKSNEGMRISGKNYDLISWQE